MTFREKWSREVIDPDTRNPWITRVYTAFTLLMLMHHVYITIVFPFPENGAIPFRFVWVILAGVTIVLGRMWKDKCFWILLALLLVKFLRIAIPTWELVRETQSVYEICIYAFFICYGAGRALSRKDRETLVSWFCALWTLGMAVLSCISLYVVWTAETVPNLGGWPIWLNVNEDRLWPIYHAVEAGTMAALSVAVALIGYFITKRKALRALYIPAAVLIFLMNIFCVCRTSYILMAMGIGAPLAMLLYELLQRWKKQGKAFTLLRVAAAFAAFGALAVLLLLVQMKAVPAYISLRTRGIHLISSAMAEEVKSVTKDLDYRAFETGEGADGFLTGRLLIWSHILDSFERFPSFRWIGQGVYNPMEHINSFIRHGLALPEIYHFHSTFIQTLWESGIPGLVLFALFFGIFAWNAARLLFDRRAPMWQRLVPLPALLCWLADMIDCAGYCNWGKPPMTLLYFFTGLTIAIARENRKNHKGAREA